MGDPGVQPGVSLRTSPDPGRVDGSGLGSGNQSGIWVGAEDSGGRVREKHLWTGVTRGGVVDRPGSGMVVRRVSQESSRVCRGGGVTFPPTVPVSTTYQTTDSTQETVSVVWSMEVPPSNTPCDGDRGATGVNTPSVCEEVPLPFS